MKNSMIGSFNIPVGKLIQELKEERTKEIKQLRDTLE
jgi:hypothetical protein